MKRISRLKILLSLLLVGVTVVIGLIVSGVLSIHSNEVIPVIMYHNVIENPKLDKIGYSISKNRFESHMKKIKAYGYNAITIKDLKESIYNAKFLPDKPILITFDDGKLNNYDNVFPIIEKYDLTCGMFVVGKNIEDNRKRDIADEIDSQVYFNLYFNRYEMKEMKESGLIDFGSHTCDMHKKSNDIPVMMTAYNLDDDLNKSKLVLTEAIGERVTSIAYPYGGYNEKSIESVKNNGYKLGFTTDTGVFKIGDNPYKIKRINIDGLCSKYRLIFEIEVLKILSMFRNTVD